MPAQAAPPAPPPAPLRDAVNQRLATLYPG